MRFTMTMGLVNLMISEKSAWPDSNKTKDYDDFDGAPILKVISFHERATQWLKEYLLKKHDLYYKK